jgi:hypothetical protein
MGGQVHNQKEYSRSATGKQKVMGAQVHNYKKQNGGNSGYNHTNAAWVQVFSRNGHGAKLADFQPASPTAV